MNEPKFKPGDRVYATDASSRRVWIVVADDTNRTPVYDPEPAYRLRDERHTHNERYAYESALEKIA